MKRWSAARAACSHESRTRAVFGDGDPGADLMFVGEAPGYHEDQQGKPFVGQAGKLLEQLLASIGLTREQVYIANVLKSRPPNNRDPRPEEIEACQPYLWRQVELIKPRVICTLGNFSTKLLSGNPAGITRVHGQPQVVQIGEHRTYLYPIFHPAAALYTPSMLSTLKDDIARLPEAAGRRRAAGASRGAAGGGARRRRHERRDASGGSGRAAARESAAPQAAARLRAAARDGRAASRPRRPAEQSPARRPPERPAPAADPDAPHDRAAGDGDAEQLGLF